MKNQYPSELTRRAYLWLVRLYPKDFRHRFGDEMFEVFRDSWRAKRIAGQRAVALRMWARALRDVAVNGVAFRIRSIHKQRDAGLRHRTSSSLLVALATEARWALRAMRRNPGFASVVVATFALAVGVNSAIFSIVDGVLFRPLPFHESDRLVRVWSSDTIGGDQFLQSTFAEVVGVRDRSYAFSAIAAYSVTPGRVVDAFSTPESVVLARLTGDLPAVLGAAPIAGRTFRRSDFAGDGGVVMLSEGLWRRRYGGSLGVIGAQVTIRDEALTVIGVLPETFDYPRDAEAWRPFAIDSYQDDDRELVMIARLADGVSTEQGNADVRALMHAIRREGADLEEVRAAWVEPLRTTVVREIKSALLVLLASVGLILLIGCVNVANLFLARASQRESELAVRTALGASNWQLVRHLMSEGIVLALVGGVAGLFIGNGLLRIVLQLAPATTPRLNEVSLDGSVVIVMLLTVTLAGAVSSAVPALRWSRDPYRIATAFRARGSTGGRGRLSIERWLVTSEVALSTMLVVVATMLMGNFHRLMNHDRGFATEKLLAVPISITDDHGTVAETRVLYTSVLEQIKPLPGVTAAALSFRSPMQPMSFSFEYRLTPNGALRAHTVRPYIHSVSEEYFSTVGLPVVRGRSFSADDNRGTKPVGIVNKAFVEQVFGAVDPIGHVLFGEEEDTIEIVGVVGDIKPDAGSTPVPILYRPFLQLVIPFNFLMVRTMSDPQALVPAIRERVWSLNPNIALDDITTIEEVVAGTIAAPRFNMILVSVFALLALSLATIGIYGVMSYIVASRRTEWGVRQVLGAERVDVLRSVLFDSMRITAVGAGVGLLLSLFASRVVATMVYDAEVGNVLVLGTGVTVLVIASIAAALIPAIRATGVTPLTALRD